jgi:anti-sigma-K factor RskA
MTDDETDLDAAERALGTLPKDGEAASDAARRAAWERRFAPLLETAEPVEPPPGLFARIMERIDEGAAVVELAALRRRVARWKGIAAMAGAVAATLAALVVLPMVSPEPAPRFVAVVSHDSDGTAGLVIELDTAEGTATVIPVGLEPPPGRTFEMWHLPEGAERPYSLGLMPNQPQVRQTLDAAPGDVFGVSIEPEGGSPTGQPTDARWHGRMIRVE